MIRADNAYKAERHFVYLGILSFASDTTMKAVTRPLNTIRRRKAKVLTLFAYAFKSRDYVILSSVNGIRVSDLFLFYYIYRLQEPLSKQKYK